jgi:hypothetical protein
LLSDLRVPAFVERLHNRSPGAWER